MANNNADIELLAALDESSSEAEILKAIKKINRRLKYNANAIIKLYSKLDIQEIQKQLNRLDTLLKSRNSGIDIKGNINNKDITSSINNALKQAQEMADKNKVKIDATFDIKKSKLLADIKYFGQQNSKLFKDANTASKYNSLLDNAKLATSNKEIKNLRLQLSALRSEIRSTGQSGLTLGDTLRKTFKRAAELFTGTGFMMLATQQLKQAWQEAMNLDKSFTSLVKVQNELTRSDYPEYLEQCNKKAKELATTQQALIEGATEFSKSGYDLTTSNKLSEQSAILSNVGEMQASESAKAIISGVQAYDSVHGFTDTIDKAKALISAYNEVGNTASITTEEIAKGVQAVGSVFADANTSVDEFIALLAAGNRVYQDADSLALGLRTAALRIRGCTVELEQMGEETDGVYTSASKLQEKIADLTNINGSGGVKILEADGETFRSIYDIFVDISKVYKDMSDTDQSALLELIAGKHRASAVSATLNNMSEAQEIYKRSLESAGSAQEEYNTYLESSEASLNRFKASMTEAYQSVIDGSTTKGILDAANSTLEFANSIGLVESVLKGFIAIGAVKGITALSVAFKASAIQASNFGTALNTVKNMESMTRGTAEYVNALNMLKAVSVDLKEAQLKQIISSKALNDSDRIAILRTTGLTKAQAQAKLSQMSLTQSTKAQTVAQNSATASTFSLTAAVKGFGVSLKAVFMSNPVGISIMALSTVIGAVTSKISEHNEAVREARQANMDAASSIKEETDELNNLYIKYTTLSGITDKTSQQEEDFKQVIQDITEALGSKAEALEGLAAGTDRYTESLEKATKAELESQYATAKIGAKAAEDALKEQAYSSWSGSKVTINKNERMTGIEEHVAALKEVEPILKQFEDISSNGIQWEPINWDKTQDMSALVEYYYALIEAREKLATSDNADFLMTSDIYEDINTTINDLKDSVEDYAEQQYEALKLNYEWQVGIPTTKEELDAMEQSILNASGAGKEFQEVLKGFLTKDFTNLSSESNADDFRQAIIDKLVPSRTDLSAGFESALNDAMEGVDADIVTNWVASLKDEELKFANSDEFINALEKQKEGLNGAILSADNYTAALQEVKDAQRQNLFENLITSKESLDKFTSSVESAYEAYSKLMNPNVSSSDILSSIQSITSAMSDMGGSLDWKFIDGQANSLDLLGNAIEYVSQKYAESVLSGAGIDVNSKFGQMLANNIIQAQKASIELENLNTNIDSLQSAYSDLTDIVESYNETGYLTFDQLQTLLELEPQYLSCLIDENGQLQLNEQAMVALANQRLNDAEAQAVQQAITELGQLALQDEKTAVEENATAFTNAVDDLSSYNQELATTIAEATVGAAQIRDLNAAISGAESQGASDGQIQTVLDNLNAKLQAINSVRDKINTDGLGDVVGKKSSSSSAKDTTESFDWIERAIESLQKRFNSLQQVIDSIFSTTGAKTKALADQIGLINKEIELQQYAYEEYMAKAESIGLSDNYKNLVQNGAINIEDITDKDLQEAISKYQEYYDKAQDTLEEINSLHEDALQKHVDCYELESDELKSKLDSQSITEKQYIDEMLVLWEKYYAKQVDLAEVAKEKKLELLDEEKSYLQSVANAATALLDNQIDDLEDQKDIAVQGYKDQIEAIEGQIDALEEIKKPLQDQLDMMEKARDKEEKILALQKAHAALKRAENQRNKLEYVDGQMIYTTDNKAIKDARKDLDDAEYELTKFNIQQQIDAIDKQIDGLNDQKDKINDIITQTEKYYDAQINGLQKYKDEWQKALDMEELAINMKNFTDMFGANSIGKLLSGDTTLIANWKQSYLDTLSEIDTTSTGTIGEITKQFADLAGIDLSNTSAQTQDVASQFNTLGDSVKDATSAIGNTSNTENQQSVTNNADNEESSDTLVGAIQTYYDVASEAIPAQIEMMNSYAESIHNVTNEVNELISSIERLNSMSMSAPSIGGNAYASGTRKAEKGLALVGEEKPEAIVNNDGKVLLAEEPTLVNMEGGETVYNGDETEKMLAAKGIRPLREEDDPILYRISHMNPDEVRAKLGIGSYTPAKSFTFDTEKSIANSNVVNNNSKPSYSMNGDVHIHCPGVTKDEVAKQIGDEMTKTFFGMENKARQRVNITR